MLVPLVLLFIISSDILLALFNDAWSKIKLCYFLRAFLLCFFTLNFDRGKLSLGGRIISLSLWLVGFGDCLMDESTLKGNWDVVLKYSKVIPCFYRVLHDVALLAKVRHSYLSVPHHVLNINMYTRHNSEVRMKIDFKSHNLPR